MSLRINHVFYCYHPDFEQVGDEYKVKNTGRWVVEWNVKDTTIKGLATQNVSYYKAYFNEECEAQTFAKKLMMHQIPNYEPDNDMFFIDEQYLDRKANCHGLDKANITSTYQVELSEI